MRRFAMATLSLAVTMAAVGYLAGSFSAMADHWTGFFTGSIHNSGVGNNEDYCVETYPSSGVSHSTALSKVGSALTGGGSGDWQGIASNKVLFSGTSTACSLLGGGLSSREARFWVDEDWDATCSQGTSGAIAFGTGTFHTNHTDYPGFNIYLRDDHVIYC